MREISLSKYFRLIHPEYVYLKLTPAKSIRNYDSDKIIKAIASMYKSLVNRMGKINKQYFFNIPCKVSYYIYLEKSNVEFYFIIPKEYMTLLKEKISDTWKSITIEITENIPLLSDNSLKYYLT